MSCPRCGSALDEDPDGYWCPECEEYYPPDIIREYIEENE